ncbi:mrpl7 [Candida jiufengensis]|uniref:mrpl7 n=1 Tax=Candida jiufengensis TaxID=497108 RepID=UPI002224F494|nr:mrpl7 [Candida jiufengensis]KAI5953644.1 mrpl7 [Candida jiufengensis]
MNKTFIRSFSQTSLRCKPGYSTVQPVHHLINVEKSKLKPSLQNVLLPQDDIRSVKYKPTEISQDRVADYYTNSIESDLLLHFYDHDSKIIEGNKRRSWGNDSPYKVYRSSRNPRGGTRSTKNQYPITNKNIPKLESIVIHSYNKNSLEHHWLNISTRLQLSVISNVKAKQIFNKSNILPWKVRVGKACGGKVELYDRDMNQFISTLTELVLPRIRAFKGIKFSSGDKNGNISFGLTAEDVQLFPELENFQELFPNLNGIDITFKTTAQNDSQAKTLLSTYGFPFSKE